MKYIVFIFLSTLLISCISNNEDDKEESISSNINLDTDNYRNAKWWVYCLNCDLQVDSCFKRKNDKLCNKTIGEINISLDTIWSTEKYNSYFFTFQSNDCDIKANEELCVINYAITVDNSNDSVCALASTEFQLATWSGAHPKSRLFYPLQPEVIKYIKDNKDKLDPWFRREAVRRGVLEE